MKNVKKNNILLLIISFLILNYNLLLADKYCSAGHKNVDKAKFCTTCGEKLEDLKKTEVKQQPVNTITPVKTSPTQIQKKIICPKCNAEFIKTNIRYCTKCGAPLFQTDKKDEEVKTTAKDNLKKEDLKIVDNQEIKNEQSVNLYNQPASAKPAEETVNSTDKQNKETTSQDKKINEKKKEKPNSASAVSDKISEKYNNLLKAGETAYNEKNYLLAMQYFKDAIKENANGEDALFNAGVLSFYLRNYSDANEYFEKLLALNKNDLDVLIYNGLSLYRLGLIEESKNNFKKVILIADKSSEHYKKAVEFFQKLETKKESLMK